MISHNIYEVIISNLNFTDTNNFSQCCRKLWRFYLLFRPYEKYRGVLDGCITHDRPDIFKQLYQKRIYYIELACKYQRTEIIKFLIDKDMYCLAAIGKYGNFEMMKYHFEKYPYDEYDTFHICKLYTHDKRAVEFIDRIDVGVYSAYSIYKSRCPEFMGLPQFVEHPRRFLICNAMNFVKTKNDVEFAALFAKYPDFPEKYFSRICTYFRHNIIELMEKQGYNANASVYKIRSIEALEYFNDRQLFTYTLLENNEPVINRALEMFDVDINYYININNWHFMEKYASPECMMLIATSLCSLKLMDKYVFRANITLELLRKMQSTAREYEHLELLEMFDQIIELFK